MVLEFSLSLGDSEFQVRPLALFLRVAFPLRCCRNHVFALAWSLLSAASVSEGLSLRNMCMVVRLCLYLVRFTLLTCEEPPLVEAVWASSCHEDN